MALLPRVRGLKRLLLKMVDTLASKLLQSKSRKYILVDSMTELSEESMGGRLTPQGSQTVIIVPISSWLISPSSRVFLDRAFDDIFDEAKSNTPESVASSKNHRQAAVLNILQWTQDSFE